jgi:hydrogenase nickel incorporation protein HypA/HybF
MHEMALAESIRALVEREAARQRCARVRTVELEVGQLASVDTDALRFALDVVLRGSVADGCAIEIGQPPGRAWCMQCSQSVLLARRGDPCPECGSYQLTVTDGEQMRVAGMVVD